MKKIKLLVAGCGILAAAAALIWKNRKKKKVPQADEPEETAEEQFLTEWSAILAEDARVFNGLYGGLLRVQRGTAKKPEKILREWCQRAHYRWEDQPVDALCKAHILPLIEAEDRDALTKWADLLLDAAASVGITRETAEALVLTETNAPDYVDWDGCEPEPDDEVEILAPAWYQNGKLLEQGQCRKSEAP